MTMFESIVMRFSRATTLCEQLEYASQVLTCEPRGYRLLSSMYSTDCDEYSKLHQPVRLSLCFVPVPYEVVYQIATFCPTYEVHPKNIFLLPHTRARVRGGGIANA